MAKACAKKLAASRDTDLKSCYDAAEEVATHDAVAQEKQLDSSMAAAVQELTTLLGSNPGWKQLADVYGGRADGCLVGHLRETAAVTPDGEVDAAAAMVVDCPSSAGFRSGRRRAAGRSRGSSRITGAAAAAAAAAAGRREAAV